MSSIVIGTTVPAFKAASSEDRQWLTHGEAMIKDALSAGFETVNFFAAIEHDGRGMEPFGQLVNHLSVLNGLESTTASYWTFSICDQSEKVDGYNRQIRICTGRNLIGEYALRSPNVSHILYLDSDLVVPPESVSKLLELDYPIVGGDVPAYCLGGPVMGEEYPTFPVQQHWNTAGFIMVNRQIFQRIQWRADHHPHGRGLTDDPTFASDVREEFGYETRVRKDVQGLHKPLVSLEQRGHDLTLHNQVS